jgi:hypothetical protein
MKSLDPEVTYGITCGVAMCAWVLAEFLLGFHTTSFEIGTYSGYFSAIIPIVFIFTSLRQRQSLNNGVLTTKDGINIGFRIALISSIIFAAFLYFYNTAINPDWIERLVEWQRKNLILSGASDDVIGQFMSQNRYRNSVVTQAIMNLINSTGIGVIITLVEIPIVKRLFRMKWREFLDDF